MAEANMPPRTGIGIPAEEVSKATEKSSEGIDARGARAGLSSGKSSITLIKKRFAEEIKAKCCRRCSRKVEKAVAEQKLTPVRSLQVDKLDYNEGRQ